MSKEITDEILGDNRNNESENKSKRRNSPNSIWSGFELGINGWLNTGRQRKRIEPGSDDRCPSFGASDETQAHILQCTQGNVRAARYEAEVKLHTTITTTSGGSSTWTVLHLCLSQWLEGRRRPKKNASTQSKINCNALLRGR
jgi:hypothetical protein